MSILTILLVLVVIGVLAWLANTYIPMQDGIKKIFNVVAIILTILWLLQAVGVLDSVKNLKIG